jgi:glycosyltransferase involved in cell wall biosynthesis
MNYLVAVDTFFGDRPSGSARVAWDIANIMKFNGARVTFFTRKQNDKDDECSIVDGIRIIRFKYPKTSSIDPFKLFKQKQNGIRIASKYLSGNKWDAVHIHTPIPGVAVRTVLGNGCKYLYTVHSPVVLEQKVKWRHQRITGKIKSAFGSRILQSMERSLIENSCRIHTLSAYTCKIIKSLYKIPREISVIPHWSHGFRRHCTKVEAREVLNWPISTKFILTVRRLAPRMGIGIALKALSVLLKSHDDLFFAIVGSGPLEMQLRSLAESLGISRKVLFLGRVDDPTLKHCYEAADLFLLPTTDLECFGLIILEALGFGLPVVATDCCAIPEIMNPILPNNIVPLGQVGAMEKKIAEWLSGTLSIPPEYELIRYVEERYSREKIAPKLLSFVCS